MTGRSSLQTIVILNLTFLIGSFSPAYISAQKITKKLTPREVARQTLPSTVLLVMRNSITNVTKSGSGFFVSENIVATNFHVIKQTTEGFAKIYGKEQEYNILGVVGIDEGNDIALLQLNGVVGKPLKLNTDASIAIGDDVFAVGNPKGLEGTFSQGIVSGIRKTDNRSLIQITASISPGSSGGAVLNSKGEVVGIAVGALESGQSLNFAINVSVLQRLLLNQQAIKPLSSPLLMEPDIAGTVIRNSLGIELVYVPPGEFMMGVGDGDIRELYEISRSRWDDANRDWFTDATPQHRVTLARGFWMGRYEVTQSEWEAVMGENPSNFHGCSRCLVESVSWEDVKAFLRKLNSTSDGLWYRLPSEAEWEYAARARTTTLYAGNGNASEMGWFRTNSGRQTHPVGLKKPNQFGLYDMHGNVYEWCEDVYALNYKKAPLDGSAYLTKNVGPFTDRVIRGGTAVQCMHCLGHVAERDGCSQSERVFDVGFRVIAERRSN